MNYIFQGSIIFLLRDIDEDDNFIQKHQSDFMGHRILFQSRKMDSNIQIHSQGITLMIGVLSHSRHKY